MIEQKIRYHCNVSPKELGEVNRTESGIIDEAYFGRNPTPGPFSVVAPLGLNLGVKTHLYNYGATYTNMESIKGLMDDLGAIDPKELKGKTILAHFGESTKILGISVPETQ